MRRVYRFITDKKTYYRTVAHIVLSIVAAVLLYKLYEGGYLSAWFLSLMVAIMALMTLSIPRRIIVDERDLIISCMLEVKSIQRKDIVSVRKIANSECKSIIPLLASWGFFGYFGLYFDIKSFERVKFYATEWNNLIEIVDIYEDRYYISCREGDQLIEQLHKERSVE